MLCQRIYLPFSLSQNTQYPQGNTYALACLCLAFTAELFICFLPPQRSSYSPNQVHPWNNLIEKIMPKQASAIKFHQATFLLYFIETAGELDQLLMKEKHIKRV